MKLIYPVFFCFLLLACNNESSNTPTDKPHQVSAPLSSQSNHRNNANLDSPPTQELSTNPIIKKTKAGTIRPIASNTLYNAEAVIPPQCYTKHQEQFNPCITCHQTYPYGSRPNAMSDGGLQEEYAFSDFGATNRWSNLFEDRRERINSISDEEIINYMNTDNYSTLIEQLENTSDWQGPIPKLQNLHLGAAAFGEYGIAKDGSRWVAFNYKPLPSTFWPTNGATDDVMIRLPQKFSTTQCAEGGYSRDTYLANLAITEMVIKDLPQVSTPAIDENKICQDINNDGVMGIITALDRPSFFIGNASHTPTHNMLYPLGTEFLHTVRYIGINSAGDITIPPRMKELRYMRKHTFLTAQSLLSAYGNEHQEKIEEQLPNYAYRQDRGSNNSFGWQLLGFIEAKEGHLRTQNQEETLFCMGCHSTVGTTIDQTFAFARKVTGSQGWGYINLKGMPDAPNVNSVSGVGEIEHYLKTAGGGNEFRQNAQMQERWFEGDNLKTDAIAAADVYTLITPSPDRALALNKAYYTIVQDQDYIHGRDANIAPAVNVYKKVDEDTPVLNQDKVQDWDIRLNW